MIPRISLSDLIGCVLMVATVGGALLVLPIVAAALGVIGQ